MKEYYVDVQEVWIQTYRVTANSAKEAVQKVVDSESWGDGEEVEIIDGSLEFSHRLNEELWTINEIK
jgi:DNA polymerase IIIc chi subunit